MILFLIFGGASILFLLVAVPVSSPTSRKAPFAPPHFQHGISCLLDDSHSNGCEVISRCGMEVSQFLNLGNKLKYF